MVGGVVAEIKSEQLKARGGGGSAGGDGTKWHSRSGFVIYRNLVLSLLIELCESLAEFRNNHDETQAIR